MALNVAAKPELPLVFGDHMVLQRNKPVPVWGKAAAGAPVKLIFGKQVKEGVAGVDGSFQLWLDAMPANNNGQSFFVISGDTVEYRDVLVGEVWLCSGQSNMEYTMNKSVHYYKAKRSQGLVKQVSEGPRISTVRFNGHQARVDFLHPELGLMVHDSSKITGFELAAADGRFYPTTAIVQKNYVLVSSPAVPAPVALRFAWKEDAEPNLFNKAGLPAEPYQTGVVDNQSNEYGK